MATYSVFAPNGELSRVLTIGEGDLSGNLLEGETCIPGVYSLHYVHEGLVLPLPTQPSPHHTFDYTTKQWVDPRTLSDLQVAKWAQIKRDRDEAEFGGFTWDGSPFDSDAISQSRIQGAVQLAAMAPGFTIDWTLADNTVRALSGSELAAVGVALGLHVGTQHAKARVLRTQIEAATTATEVEAVAW